MSSAVSCLVVERNVALQRAQNGARLAHCLTPRFNRQRRCKRIDCLCRPHAKDGGSDAKSAVPGGSNDPAKVTEKYGLEAGLFSAFRNNNSQVSAKDLLQRYGAAYLVTSITLALFTFSLCYVAVDAGIDVPALLARVGISVGADSAGEKAGTLALAYAAHKALSPVRFPPTVALTPLVAQRFGKQRVDESETTSSE
jgi:hypothetical protein